MLGRGREGKGPGWRRHVTTSVAPRQGAGPSAGRGLGGGGAWARVGSGLLAPPAPSSGGGQWGRDLRDRDGNPATGTPPPAPPTDTAHRHPPTGTPHRHPATGTAHRHPPPTPPTGTPPPTPPTGTAHRHPPPAPPHRHRPPTPPTGTPHRHPPAVTPPAPKAPRTPEPRHPRDVRSSRAATPPGSDTPDTETPQHRHSPNPTTLGSLGTDTPRDSRSLGPPTPGAPDTAPPYTDTPGHHRHPWQPPETPIPAPPGTRPSGHQHPRLLTPRDPRAPTPEEHRAPGPPGTRIPATSKHRTGTPGYRSGTRAPETPVSSRERLRKRPGGRCPELEAELGANPGAGPGASHLVLGGSMPPGTPTWAEGERGVPGGATHQHIPSPVRGESALYLDLEGLGGPPRVSEAGYAP
ncbi:extensin-like [Corvus hawaiiensis]|uniref:extensin-like n=1 Tax=Corvus hawaiiensis TaxID=134902 RepID=UPI002019C170|nr:extensin-like [Corvus hawaiiensis]